MDCWIVGLTQVVKGRSPSKRTALAGLTTNKCNSFVVNAARHVLGLFSSAIAEGNML
jgi:hypothetical protein